MQETATTPALIADKLAILPGTAQAADQHEQTLSNGTTKALSTVNPLLLIDPRVGLAMYDPKWQQ